MEYAYIFPKLSQVTSDRSFLTPLLHPTLFPKELFTYSEYLWACSVFTSRNWAPKQDAILPLTEAFNFAKEVVFKPFPFF